jgi:hypothetical protein
MSMPLVLILRANSSGLSRMMVMSIIGLAFHRRILLAQACPLAAVWTRGNAPHDRSAGHDVEGQDGRACHAGT